MTHRTVPYVSIRVDDPILAIGRSVPLRVLVLGMPRTGTMTLWHAARKIGLHPYHFSNNWSESHMALWTKALEAKYNGRGEPWGRNEFDQVLGNFDCTMDVPSALFVDELVNAYPEAKVILSNRDVDQWIASMQKTLFEVFSWRSWPLLALLDPSFTGVYYRHFRVTWQGFCENDFRGPLCRQRFLDHYDHVRAVVPPERLLEFKVSDGWEPLCRFLNVDVPEEEFPNVNDLANFTNWHIGVWHMSVRRSLSNVALAALAISLPLALALPLRRR